MARRRRNKFGNIKCKYDGYVFDSKLEQARYQQLMLWERAGEISNLIVHPKYKLLDGFRLPSGKKQQAITWSADFEYIDNDTGLRVVEDVKSPQTAAKDSFRIRVKMFQARYKIEVSVLLKDDII
jgi:hypothetical protein